MVMLTWPKWRDGIYENGSTGTFPSVLTESAKILSSVGSLDMASDNLSQPAQLVSSTSQSHAEETDQSQPHVSMNDHDEGIDSVWQSLTKKPSKQDTADAQSEDAMRLFNGQPLTTRSEILAWYLVDWANSPTFNVLFSLVIPLYLAQMATNYACSHGAENGCDINGELIGSSDDVVVDIGLFSVNANSFTFSMISISGGTQFISYLFIGALADYSFYSFYLFRITAVIAAFVVGVWGFMADSKHYLFAGFWVSVQLVFFGLSIIFYNAMLPKMVENHWFVSLFVFNEYVLLYPLNGKQVGSTSNPQQKKCKFSVQTETAIDGRSESIWTVHGILWQFDNDRHHIDCALCNHRDSVRAIRWIWCYFRKWNRFIRRVVA